MSAAVEADLTQLDLVFKIFARADKAVDTRDIHIEISERLREELDYDLKGDLCRFTGHAVGRGGCSCAGTLPISSGRLLTMTWLDGEPLLNYAEAPLEVGTLYANMFRAGTCRFIITLSFTVIRILEITACETINRSI